MFFMQLESPYKKSNRARIEPGLLEEDRVNVSPHFSVNKFSSSYEKFPKKFVMGSDTITGILDVPGRIDTAL